MSHQTGISADESVLAAFTSAKSGETRLMKLVISADSSHVVADAVLPVQRDWESDYDNMIVGQVQGTAQRRFGHSSTDRFIEYFSMLKICTQHRYRSDHACGLERLSPAWISRNGN